MAWYNYALLTALSFTLVFIGFKQVSGSGIAPAIILFYTFLLGAVALLIHSTASGLTLRIPVSVLIVLILITVPNYVGNILQLNAVSKAPNPGYALGIISCQALFVSIASIFIFHSKISLLKVLGIILSIAGAICLSL